MQKENKSTKDCMIYSNRQVKGDRKPVFTVKHATENPVYILDVCQKMPHIENLQIVSINCKESYIIKQYL